MVHKHHDLGERVQALTLLTYGLPASLVAKHTTLSVSEINRIRTRAKNRGFNPMVSPIILLEYVIDAPRSGRPRKATAEKGDATIPAVTVGQPSLGRNEVQNGDDTVMSNGNRECADVNGYGNGTVYGDEGGDGNGIENGRPE